MMMHANNFFIYLRNFEKDVEKENVIIEISKLQMRKRVIRIPRSLTTTT